MDTIKAIKRRSKYSADIEHLNIFVNGEQLDELLAKATNQNYLGLIPSWLNFNSQWGWCELDKKELGYLWSCTKLDDDGEVKELPILLCPDDFDFSCTVIVVEVINQPTTVVWSRFGIEKAEVRFNKSKVEWFSNIKPLMFDKTQYWKCVKEFYGLLCPMCETPNQLWENTTICHACGWAKEQ